MKRIFPVLAVVLVLCAPALAGDAVTPAQGGAVTSPALDALLGNTQGGLATRTSTGWANGGAGLAGQVWTSGGPGVNSAWGTIATTSTPSLAQVLAIGADANKVAITGLRSLTFDTGLGGITHAVGPSDNALNVSGGLNQYVSILKNGAPSNSVALAMNSGRFFNIDGIYIRTATSNANAFPPAGGLGLETDLCWFTGNGGTATLDTRLRRTAGATLTLDDNAGGAGTLISANATHSSSLTLTGATITGAPTWSNSQTLPGLTLTGTLTSNSGLAQGFTTGGLILPNCLTGAPSGAAANNNLVVGADNHLWVRLNGAWAQLDAQSSGASSLSATLAVGASTGGSAGSHTITFSEADNITFGTTTGTKIGTTTTGKIGFFNATPVVQTTGSTDVLAGLVTIGLRAASSNPPLNLGTGTVTAGSVTQPGILAVGLGVLSGTNTAGADLQLGTATGTGTGNPADFYVYGSTRIASGSTSQDLTHLIYARGRVKTLTNNTATRFCDISLNPATDTDAHGGGCIVYFSAQANDGTNYQAISGFFVVTWVTNASNVAAATASTATTATQAASGTITATPSVSIGSPGVRISLNINSSLTTTTENMNWTIVNLGASGLGPQ